jgi:hypothetical protein
VASALRSRSTVLLPTLAFGVTLAWSGCGDLFHDTQWTTGCERDGSGVAACGAGGAGGAGSPSAVSVSSGSGSGGEGGAGGSGGSGGAPCTKVEDCTTAADDDCSGAANESCPPIGYAFSVAPPIEYDDEAHNAATTGNEADGSAFADFALGQLVDGIKGGDDFGDLGNGPAFEWVVWLGEAEITFDFGVVRDFSQLGIGMSNVGLYIFQPSEVHVSLSEDGTSFTRFGKGFSLADGTLPSIPLGKRADVALVVAGSGRYLRIGLVPGMAALAIDEVTFD